MTQPQAQNDNQPTKDLVPVKKIVPLSYQGKIGGYVMDNEGTLYEISEMQGDALTHGKVQPVGESYKGDKGYPIWQIDENGERYTTSTTYYSNTVNSCVYDAVKKYVEAMGLGTLTHGDKKFFTSHPRVNTDGVNKANVLAVSQGLIVPWGLGITRVFVPKLSSLGDQHLEFANALGVNPMGLSNYSTSNQEFLEFFDIDRYSEEGRSMLERYRFEFVDKPNGPCVVMVSSSAVVNTSKSHKKGQTNVGGNWSSTVHGLGHADFVGPRDGLAAKWQIAFQIGRLPEYNDNNINRYEDVTIAFAGELKDKPEPKASKKLSTWNSIVGGKTINTWDNEKRGVVWRGSSDSGGWSASQSKKNGGSGHTDISPAKQLELIRGAGRTSIGPCPKCNGRTHTVEGMNYCLQCDWYKDTLTEHTNDVKGSDKEDSSGVCPFCYGSLASDGICTNDDCGYDPADWTESNFFVCKEHAQPLYFRLVQPKDSKSIYVYACTECLFKDGEGLKEYMDEGKTHPPRKSIQIKEIKTEEGGGDDDK